MLLARFTDASLCIKEESRLAGYAVTGDLVAVSTGALIALFTLSILKPVAYSTDNTGVAIRAIVADDVLGLRVASIDQAILIHEEANILLVTLVRS